MHSSFQLLALAVVAATLSRGIEKPWGTAGINFISAGSEAMYDIDLDGRTQEISTSPCLVSIYFTYPLSSTTFVRPDFHSLRFPS